MVDPNDEHFIASAILSGLLSHYGISTLLDCWLWYGAIAPVFERATS
ncbi:MAG: hypothetical protein HC800_23760 [Phormidesmis sp. RL_2_1]|nr:hypothetical protein [Phormidesmis sp. RL_2_1]